MRPATHIEQVPHSQGMGWQQSWGRMAQWAHRVESPGKRLAVDRAQVTGVSGSPDSDALSATLESRHRRNMKTQAPGPGPPAVPMKPERRVGRGVRGPGEPDSGSQGDDRNPEARQARPLPPSRQHPGHSDSGDDSLAVTESRLTSYPVIRTRSQIRAGSSRG